MVKVNGIDVILFVTNVAGGGDVHLVGSDTFHGCLPVEKPGDFLDSVASDDQSVWDMVRESMHSLCLDEVEVDCREDYDLYSDID